MSIQVLKAVAKFNENQEIAPRFILTYLAIWFVWHIQLLISFATMSGDLLIRANTALTLIVNSHYFIVFAVTCFFYIVRLSYYFLKNRTQALLEDNVVETEAGAAQSFDKSDDIDRLMSMVTDLKAQLLAMKQKEEKTNSDKNLAIKKFLAVRGKLEEVSAENLLLTKSNKALKAKLTESYNLEESGLESRVC